MTKSNIIEFGKTYRYVVEYRYGDETRYIEIDAKTIHEAEIILDTIRNTAKVVGKIG